MSFRGRPRQRKLTLEALLRMSPIVDGKDIVAHASRQLFLSRARSVPSVRDAFFPNHKENAYEESIDSAWFDFDRFACLLVCQGVYKLKDQHQIHLMVDGNKTEDFLFEMYRSPQWKKIGFALYTLLFPDFVKDFDTGLSFKHFMEDDRVAWAQQLLVQVRDSRWQYGLVHPIIKGQTSDSEYNREVNTLLIKLHLLDPKSVMMAYHHLRKALPDLNLELATTDYLHVGEPLDWHYVKAEIKKALEEESCPTNVSRLSLVDIDAFYGVRVVEFITNHAKEYGLWTGKYPRNKRVLRFRDRCIIL